MPILGKPQQERLRPEELTELQFRGPFGGIQSEVPLDDIENFGFADSLNVIYRKSRASVRPGYTALLNANEPILGIADFFNIDGDHVQVVMTPTQLLKWQPGTLDWLALTGTLTGTNIDLFTFAVVNHKLLFSQGVDTVREWDGLGGAFIDAFASNPTTQNVSCKHMIELGTHLIMGFTIEGGSIYTQRMRWSRSGEPENLDAFSAGAHDELGDLGPITGLVKLYQQGYQFHERGIVRIIPTGIALRAFDFVPISSNNRGNICPYSLASYGEYAAFYIGKDNIYMFDSVESVPIGGRPTQGNKFFGARSRIFAELKTSDLKRVTGFVTTSIAGNDYNAYHLVIPGGSHWIYNIDEGNWCRQQYDRTPVLIGDFFSPQEIRWLDLIGTWNDQSARWTDFNSTSPLSSMLIGFDDGTPGNVDFTTRSELSWLIKSGRLTFNDRRHSKTISRIRFTFDNSGPVHFFIRVSNDKCQVEEKCIDYDGSDCSEIVTRIESFKVTGLHLNFQIFASGDDIGTPLDLIEVTPIYDVGGEHRAIY